jgi:hypothetical protein
MAKGFQHVKKKHFEGETSRKLEIFVALVLSLSPLLVWHIALLKRQGDLPSGESWSLLPEGAEEILLSNGSICIFKPAGICLKD